MMHLQNLETNRELWVCQGNSCVFDLTTFMNLPPFRTEKNPFCYLGVRRGKSSKMLEYCLIRLVPLETCPLENTPQIGIHPPMRTHFIHMQF